MQNGAMQTGCLFYNLSMGREVFFKEQREKTILGIE